MAGEVAAARFTVLRQLIEIARDQRRALTAGDLPLFQRHLDEREELIARLHEIGAGAEDLPENVIAFPRAADSDAQDRLALDAVLHGILRQDRENEALLAEMMEEIRDATPGLAVARRAAEGYRAAAAGPTFIDRVS